MRSLSLALEPSSALLFALACTPSPAPEQRPEVAVPAPAASASQASEPTTSDDAASGEAGKRSWKAGERVVARGKVSRVPWQHLMTGVPGKQSEYFDLSDGWQTVIYAKDLPSCAGTLEVEGTVLSVRGPSKRPGRETKVDDSYEELQLDVTAARCIE